MPEQEPPRTGEGSLEMPQDGPHNVDAYLSRVGPPYPSEVDARLLALADEAVAAHPKSAALWIARGDLIQLSGDVHARWPFAESARSYERAVAAEPENAAGHEELGIWLEIHCEERWEEAAELLDRAIALGGGPGAYVSRARIFADSGHEAEAEKLLRACPFQDSELVRDALRPDRR